MSSRSKAFLMLTVANLFWGLSFPLIKAIELANERLVPDASGTFVAIYTIAPRFVIGIAVFVIWLRGDILGISRGEWKRGTIVALFGAGGMFLQNDGMRFTSASTSAFLTQLYAVLIPLWIWVRRGRPPPPLLWFCCGLVLAGVAILGGFDFRTFGLGRGEIETLLCSVFFGGQILWVEKSGVAGDRPVQLTVAISFVLGAISWIAAMATAPTMSALLVPWTDPGWLALVLPIGLISTVAAFLLMMTWQPKVSASEAGVIYCTEPVFASALALFLPAILSGWTGISYANERFTLSLILGGALITAANLLLQFASQKNLSSQGAG